MPALFTRMSTLPNSSCVVFTTRSASANADMSHWTAMAFLPIPLISSSIFLASSSCFRKRRQTFAPSLANSMEVAAPIPWEPPLTIAFFPSKSIGTLLIPDGLFLTRHSFKAKLKLHYSYISIMSSTFFIPEKPGIRFAWDPHFSRNLKKSVCAALTKGCMFIILKIVLIFISP